MSHRRARWIRWVLLGSLAFGGVSCANPAYLVVKAWLRDERVADTLPPGYVDDASRMNATRVAEVWDCPTDPAEAERQLRSLLARARRDKLRVTASGARHSMGGQTIAPDGIVLNMLPLNRLELDAAGRLLRAGAGARWADIVPFLDAHGLSVGVMQSNNPFTVGGSLSVNCHGWQHNRPPIASTVEALRVMRADGTVVRCDRKENAELFSLVLGGYGLFGVILEAELRVVPNERYRIDAETVPCERYVERFREKVDGAADVGMVYGRLCVVPGEATFLREVILTVFRRSDCAREEIPPLKGAGYEGLRRGVYRAQIGSDAGKELRWKAERKVASLIAGHFVSRNQLLNEDVTIYGDQGPHTTDVLHEYFVPPEAVGSFLDRVRSIVPRWDADLLNVTVRNVVRDEDSYLRYADRDVFAFVMLFNQPRTPEADTRMEAMTRELIDAAVDLGGRYYLPYRLHATVEQFYRAYPQARQFFERKRAYDPDEVFQNRFYAKYARP